MELKEIQELIKLLDSTDISEFKLKADGFSLEIRTKAYTEAVALSKAVVSTAMPQLALPSVGIAPAAEATVQPVAAAAPPAASKSDSDAEEAGLVTIKSPMVGTFYRAASQDKPPYISVGDTVAKGAVLCIIEAMKLFNEIEAEHEGQIVRILVENGSPVAYDQPLFLIRP